MSTLVLKLTDPDAVNVAFSGGKAAPLARMALARFPVPAGFVVTTAVYSNVVAKISGQIRPLVGGLSAEELPAISEASEAIGKLFEGLELPEATLELLRAAYVELQVGAVAARSSATDEDLAEASFAGLYETYLNLLSFDQFIDAMRKVWASTYSPRAIAYRLANRRPHSDVQMAVLIQEQVAADAAGVMFTADPLSGGAEYIVNAAFGLGEGVVDGTVESDHFVLEPQSGTILSSEIVVKSSMIGASVGGGVGRVDAPRDRGSEPVLSQDQLADLAGQGRKLVDLFGAPQDVEFALAEGQILLLQSRPITGLGGGDLVDWEAAVDPKHHWQLDRMSVHVGPVYQLQQDIVESFVRGAKQCFELTGVQRSQPCVVEFVEGQAYRRALEVPEEVAAERRQVHSAFCEEFYARGTSNYLENVAPAMGLIIDDLGRLRLAGSKLPVRVEYLASANDAYGLVMGHLHWCMRGFDERPEWGEIFHELTGEPAQDSLIFLQALPNRSTRLVGRLRGLARIVQDDPELSKIFAEGRYDELESARLQGQPNLVKFRRRLRSMMRIYGFRTGWSFGSHSGFETPTWNMDPGRPLGIIASYAEQDLDEMTRRDAEALRERVNATRRVKRKLAADPAGLAAFNLELIRAQNEVWLMEDHNHLMEQCTVGHLQEAIHLTGVALVKLGLLDLPKDVLYFSLEELRGVVASGSRAGDLRAMVEERRFERESRKLLDPPMTLGAPASPSAPRGAPVVEAEPLDPNKIKGTSASGGQATGPARIVTAETPVGRWQRGDVMVAVNVGQDWTSVFPLLGGLVLDQGAVFQHAALIAREYRIPAVIRAGDATRRIADGQTITVDGDAGAIYLA